MLANFRSGVLLTEQPLRLQVLNGNGVGGSAGEMSQTLEGMGFSVESIGNAETKDYQFTTIIVPEGSAHGDTILNALGFGVVQVGIVDNGYDAVVITGADAT